MRVGETERDYNGGRWEWSRDDRMGKRSYEGTQKHTGRAEVQTKLICLSLRLKRGARGDRGWSVGLEEEKKSPSQDKNNKKRRTKSVHMAEPT